MQLKVNRFTFDAHSVVLFSALVLSTAVTAGSPPSQSSTPLAPVAHSHVSVQTVQSVNAQQALPHAATQHASARDTHRTTD